MVTELGLGFMRLPTWWLYDGEVDQGWWQRCSNDVEGDAEQRWLGFVLDGGTTSRCWISSDEGKCSSPLVGNASMAARRSATGGLRWKEGEEEAEGDVPKLSSPWLWASKAASRRVVVGRNEEDLGDEGGNDDRDRRQRKAPDLELSVGEAWPL